MVCGCGKVVFGCDRVGGWFMGVKKRWFVGVEGGWFVGVTNWVGGLWVWRVGGL